MKRKITRFDVQTTRTTWRRVTTLANRSGCSTNLYINTLLDDAIRKQRIISVGRRMKYGTRRKTNCRFV